MYESELCLLPPLCGYSKPAESDWKSSYVLRISAIGAQPVLNVYHQRAGLSTFWSKRCFQELSADLPWEQKSVESFGRRIVLPRFSALLSERDGDVKLLNDVQYTTSIYTPAAWMLKLSMEERLARTDRPFGAILAFKFENGDHHLGYHFWKSLSGPTQLGDQQVAFMWLGAPRHLLYRDADANLTKKIQMQDGSVLVTDHTTFETWKLSVPKSKNCRAPSILLIMF